MSLQGIPQNRGLKLRYDALACVDKPQWLEVETFKATHLVEITVKQGIWLAR